MKNKDWQILGDHPSAPSGMVTVYDRKTTSILAFFAYTIDAQNYVAHKYRARVAKSQKLVRARAKAKAAVKPEVKENRRTRTP